MATEHSSSRNSTLSRGWCAAWLDSRVLRGEEFLGYLSNLERAKYVGLPGQGRKREWLAGRLAAKYLFLNRLEMSEGTQRQWSPTLLKLSPKSLGAYSPWMYRKVEVLPDDTVPGGRPKIVWCGKDHPENVSLSHTGNVSCACLVMGPAAAIDIETSVPRIDAFYRNTFTSAERSWVTSGAEGKAIRSDWLFTVLWTLKESALKLGWLNQPNIWDLPRIEIDGLPGADEISQFWYRSKMDDEFAVFTARVRERCRVMQTQVAVTGTRNLILTVMNPLGVTS